MNLRKSALSFLLMIQTLLYSSPSEKIKINFTDLSIQELIHITSKQIDKNILIIDSVQGNVDFVSNQQLNSSELFNLLKMVLESKGYVLKLDKGIYKVIQKQTKNNHKKSVEIISLNNADVETVFPVLEELLQHRFKNKQLFVSKDNSSNALVLLGLQEDIALAKEIITELDHEKYQVYVEAKIVEQSELKTKSLGLKYGLSGLDVSGNTIFSLGANLGGVSNAVNESIFSLFSFETKTLQSAISLGATLNFLNENQVIDIVSQPSILCMNNKESIIYVGETKSFQTGSTTTDGGTTNNSFQREDIGLTLKIKPRVSNEQKVVLDIQAIQEDAKELQVGQVNPDTTKKEVKTTAIVSNGESVILGGLIKNKQTQVNTEVPILSDIPLLGNLFKDSKNAKDRINLVVILTPYIVPSSKNLTQVAQELSSLKALQKKFAKKLEENLQEEKTTTAVNSVKVHQQHLQQLGLSYE